MDQGTAHTHEEAGQTSRANRLENQEEFEANLDRYVLGYCDCYFKYIYEMCSFLRIIHLRSVRKIVLGFGGCNYELLQRCTKKL